MFTSLHRSAAAPSPATSAPTHQRDLEDRIGWAMGRLLPREIERLKTLATAPQLALAQRLRALVKDIVLGREEGRG